MYKNSTYFPSFIHFSHVNWHCHVFGHKSSFLDSAASKNPLFTLKTNWFCVWYLNSCSKVNCCVGLMLIWATKCHNCKKWWSSCLCDGVWHGCIANTSIWVLPMNSAPSNYLFPNCLQNVLEKKPYELTHKMLTLKTKKNSIQAHGNILKSNSMWLEIVCWGEVWPSVQHRWSVQ